MSTLNVIKNFGKILTFYIDTKVKNIHLNNKMNSLKHM